MNTEKFTPAPWFISNKRDMTIIDAEGKAICKMFARFRRTSNIDLVRNSPEMYLLLTVAVKELYRTGGDDDIVTAIEILLRKINQ